jgi:hypothetical protein
LSNTGEATGFSDRGQTNAFQYWGGPIRVTDRNGKVLFSGEGPEAAAEAVRFAQNLSDTKGANAAWDIQQGERTINPDGSVGEMRWISGPSDAKDGRGIIGDLGAFVIPAITALATAGLSIPAQIAAAAAAGAAGSAFADRDPLEGAVMGGLTAAGGSVLGPALGSATDIGAKAAGAIGTGLGATAGGLLTGQSLENALLSGLASGAGSYVMPGVAEELGLTTPWPSSTGAPPSGGGSGSFDGITVNAPAPISPPVSFGDGSGSNATGDARADTLDGDEIVVSGTQAPPFTPAISTPITLPTGMSPIDAGLMPEPTPLEQLPLPDDIVVSGTQGTQAPPNIPISLPSAPQVTNPLDTGLIDVVASPPTAPEPQLPVYLPPAVEAPATNPLDTGLIDVTASPPTAPEPQLPVYLPPAVEAPAVNPLDTGLIDVTASRPTVPEEQIPISAPQTNNPLDTGLIDVMASPPTASEPQLPVYLPPAVEAPAVNPLDTGLIDVTASRPTQPDLPNAPIPLALPTYQTLPTGPQPDLLKDVQPEAPKEDTRLKDIADYLRIAGLLSSLLGGLAGSGGGGSGQKFNVPGTMGKLNPIFGAKLPPANLPGLGVGGGGSGARSPSDLAARGLSAPIDYYRYGYGPEQSFFNYVPQGARNTSKAYTGYARGGFAVEGAGDGRDDKIPALLSDGEYVIDAETVALLGNGSNKAGAQMLDKFRVNVRKQKGRKLARGEFSENAKRPEHYMAGGRL